MKFNSSNFRLWATLGSRAAYGLAALELGETIDSLAIISADTSTSAGLERFKKKFPEKYLDVGIAEQNLIGIAAGLASEGFTVFTSTFAPFQVLRCCEQIKMNLGYMRHPVKMVGLASGVSLGPLGNSHFAIEDLAITRAIEGLCVLSPADPTETIKAVIAASTYDGPVYIRLTGAAKASQIYYEDYDFEIGKVVTLTSGSDVRIFATGAVVAEALSAAETLRTLGISVGVSNVHSLMPLDHNSIYAAVQSCELVVTVEEHGLIGGLGSAVAEIKSKLRTAAPILSFGLANLPKSSQSYASLLKHNQLTGDQMAKAISETLSKKHPLSAK